MTRPINGNNQNNDNNAHPEQVHQDAGPYDLQNESQNESQVKNQNMDQNQERPKSTNEYSNPDPYSDPFSDPEDRVVEPPTRPFTPSQTPFTAGWIMKITVLLSIAIAGVMFFVAKDPYSMIMGLAFGSIFSILNFRLLHLTIQKSMTMTPNQAKSYVTSRYIIRYLLAGTMLFVAITNDTINVLGAVIGLLIIKGVIFGINFYDAMKKGLNKG